MERKVFDIPNLNGMLLTKILKLMEMLEVVGLDLENRFLVKLKLDDGAEDVRIAWNPEGISFKVVLVHDKSKLMLTANEWPLTESELEKLIIVSALLEQFNK